MFGHTGDGTLERQEPRSDPRVVVESRIVGAFRGDRGGRVNELADGSRWRQEERIDE
jgi:hypothetical protein